ncbi:MAG: hypothetical protein Kow0058_19260 [Roseovarius sp.]
MSGGWSLRMRVRSKSDTAGARGYIRESHQDGESLMLELTIVYWRDIPAQVIAGKGRGAVKRQLPERFEQAIDRAAMKVGADGADDYLAEWRKVSIGHVEGDPVAVAEAEAARLDAQYDQERLKALIDNDGWA